MSTLAVAVTWDDAPTRLELAQIMTGALAAHAPDGADVIEAPGAALGFGRLVVSRGQGHHLQPLRRPDFGLFLVADARIDNRAELAAELGLFRESTGAEVILAAFARWGDEAPRHLDGDYALALWDARRRRLFAARDPSGVRPLVYRILPDRLLVASDVEQILAVDPSARRVDDRSVVDFLIGRPAFHDRTYFEAIRAVPNGHSLIADGRTAIVRRHFEVPPLGPRFSDETEAFGELRRVFFQAVRERLESDHPAVLHASGGFDSSSVVSVADRLRRDGETLPPLRAVAAVYPGLACDEWPIIKSFETHLGFPLETWDGTQSTLADLTNPALRGPGTRATMTDGTAGDVELARSRGARILLTGFGGEIFDTPFGIFRDLLAEHELDTWWAHVASARRLPPSQLGRFAMILARESLPEGLRAELRPFRRARGLSAPAALLTPLARALAAEPRPTAPLPPCRLAAHRASLSMFTGPLLPFVLGRNQARAGQEHVEIRAPFLDRAVLSVALRLPLQSRGVPAYGCRIQRRALGDLLPSPIRDLRRKTTFEDVLAHQLAVAGARPTPRANGPVARYLSVPWGGAPPPALAWAAARLEPWLDRVLG
jgi:asparagine synthase (glutamine-hydrolysing)